MECEPRSCDLQLSKGGRPVASPSFVCVCVCVVMQEGEGNSFTPPCVFLLVYVCACVHACVHTCMCVCVRACMFLLQETRNIVYLLLKDKQAKIHSALCENNRSLFTNNFHSVTCSGFHFIILSSFSSSSCVLECICYEGQSDCHTDKAEASLASHWRPVR